jgi:DNA polymerase sigma
MMLDSNLLRFVDGLSIESNSLL